MDTIRVFLADDHRLVLECMRPQLEREPDLVVVGEALDGVEALAAVPRPERPPMRMPA